MYARSEAGKDMAMMKDVLDLFARNLDQLIEYVKLLGATGIGYKLGQRHERKKHKKLEKEDPDV